MDDQSDSSAASLSSSPAASHRATASAPALAAAATRTPVSGAMLRHLGFYDADADPGWDRLTWATAHAVRAPIAALAAIDGDAFVIKGGVGIRRDRQLSVTARTVHRFANMVAESRRSLSNPGCASGAMPPGLTRRDTAAPHALLGVPLRLDDDTVIGSLVVAAPGPRSWSSEDEQLLRAMAESVAAELHVRMDIWLAGREAVFGVVPSRRGRGPLADEARPYELSDAPRRLARARRLEKIGLVAAGVAHDLRNYLTVVSAYSELLLNDIAPDSPMRRDVEEIRRAADSSSALTRQLLTLGGADVPPLEVVDLAPLLRGTERLLRRLTHDHGTLEIELPDTPVRIRAEREQIRRILVNLVSNSHDAIDANGTITVRLAEADVSAARARSLRLGAPGRYAVLSVLDDGAGIPAALLDRVFDPFFTTKPPNRGTGLGLAIVHGIAQQLRGAVTVRSALAGGTRVDAYLPVAGVRGDESRFSAADGPADRRAGTLLVMSFDHTMCGLLQRALVVHGYRVLCSNGVGDAIDVSRRHAGEIDVAVLDLHRGSVEPAEMVAALREHNADLSFVHIADDIGAVESAVARTDVVTGYLERPFTLDRLATTVADVLEIAMQRR